MSVEDCINAAVAAGKMSAKGSAEYKRRMADAEALAAQKGMAGPTAGLWAATEAAMRMEKAATNKRNVVQLTILATDRAWGEAAKNSKGVGYGLTTVLGERVAGNYTGLSIEMQRRGNLGEMQSILSDFLANVQSRMGGLKQNYILPQHTVSALYGRDTGDKIAKGAAQAWDQLHNWWSEGMANAGVFIRKMEDWRLPQPWDQSKVRNAGKDAYRQQMMTWWQEGKLAIRDWYADGDAYLTPTQRTMTEEQIAALRTSIADQKKALTAALDTIAKAQGRDNLNAARKAADDIRAAIARDEAALSLRGGIGNERAQEIIERAYDNISTGGDATLKIGEMREQSLADKYNRRRVFEWTTDESWLEFNRTFGVGDHFIGEAMIKHVDHLSRDLAVAQVLGPDPNKAARILIEMYRKERAGSRRAKIWANRLEAIYEMSSGHSNVPVSQELALVGHTVRAGLTAVQLGGAVLSSASDFGFTKATASWHGLSMTNIMTDYLSNLRPQSVADRATAMKDGLLLEVGLRGFGDTARDAIQDVRGSSGAQGVAQATLNGASQIAGRAAEFVIRAQGLSHQTQMLRDAIGAEMQSHLGELAGTKWADLRPVDKRTFETYGMGEKQWEILRTQSVSKGFLIPTIAASSNIPEVRDAGVKMIGAISSIQRMGVPEANVVTRSLMGGELQPGTFVGETMRNLFQYKGFPIASFMMHYFRAVESLADARGQWFRGEYLATVIVATTILGAVSLQLKNIAAGKDPEPMFTPENGPRFWAWAAAQGGALGIMGDQIKALLSASGQGDPARAMSPTAGLISDLWGLSFGNLGQNIQGVPHHFGREGVRFANKYTPDIWYTRLAMDRLVWDTLQKMVDPEAALTFARIEERARKQQQTNLYWRPGTDAPRAPHWENALRGL